MSRICSALSEVLYHFNIALNFVFFTLTNGNGGKLRISLSAGPGCSGGREVGHEHIVVAFTAVRTHSPVHDTQRTTALR